jgi:hypothetical protein
MRFDRFIDNTHTASGVVNYRITNPRISDFERKRGSNAETIRVLGLEAKLSDALGII